MAYRQSHANPAFKADELHGLFAEVEPPCDRRRSGQTRGHRGASGARRADMGGLPEACGPVRLAREAGRETRWTEASKRRRLANFLQK